jgi:hypothetical protein
MGVVLLTTMFLAGQMPLPVPSLAMKEVEACRIEFTYAADLSPVAGRWGGQIGLYDAETDQTGSVIALKRRIIEGRENLPKRVRLDQLENCLRKWKFDGGGAFMIRLLGGPIFEGFWVIEVLRDKRAFRLRLPVATPLQ